MSKLAPTFDPKSSFSEYAGYSLLPFRFLRLDESRTVLTNLAGEHRVVPSETVQTLIEHKLNESAPDFLALEAGHFICRDSPAAHHELVAAQVRTRRSMLPELAALHMFVVTLRCDQSCSYCQVSRVSEDRTSYDMSDDSADRAVDLMFAGPAQKLKIEFQGGEPLLNFRQIERIVRRAESRAHGREISFVAATNLSLVTDQMLDFFAEHRVFISTSLDGPADLHNRNRPRPGRDSYETTIRGIERCRNRLGHDSVSALMTCTAESLKQPEAIIDEYVERGFHEIFLREISPYGFAVRSSSRVMYETERFLEFYRRGLDHILALNCRGTEFREVYTTILLTRMLTSHPTGYVDLQSPTGAGLGALVYNYNGDVYASDEGRMLAEMGDTTFRLGNVYTSSWSQIYADSPILDIAHQTMTEGVPGCSECAFQPWCGSDPVRNHTIQRDFVGHRPTSAFCRKNMEIMRHLVRILEDEPEYARILRRWIR